MEQAELDAVKTAVDKVKAAPGVFFVGLNRKEGGPWKAAVAHESLRSHDVIQDGCPGLFSAESEHAATAVDLCLEKALQAEAAGGPR